MANSVWCAWEPFERGYMLWRKDTQQVVVLYANGTWEQFSDPWQEGQALPSRGNPPEGRVVPVRGFGLLWGSNDDVFKRLGWATADESGADATIQYFENGYVAYGGVLQPCIAVRYDGTWRRG